MVRYLTFNNFLQNLFHCKVFKISIDASFSCPNRDGTKAYGGCIFCDKQGSSSRVHFSSTPIKEQILNNINIRKTRYKAEKFIAYFQSFSNTYKDVKELKKLYDDAVYSHPDIVGLSISTRADCIDEEKVALIASYKKFLPYVSIELGLQTIHDKTLKLINRQETLDDFLKAYNLIKKTDIHLCIHIIIGLLNETKEDMLETAKFLSSLKIDGVKLHMLIALKDTIIAKMYEDKKWNPLSFDEYVQIATDFIEYLPKNCIVHRTAGSGYAKDIVAPEWIYTNKIQIMLSIQNELIRRNSFQGYKNPNNI